MGNHNYEPEFFNPINFFYTLEGNHAGDQLGYSFSTPLSWETFTPMWGPGIPQPSFYTLFIGDSFWLQTFGVSSLPGFQHPFSGKLEREVLIE